MLSVIIITKNEEKNIADCLESLKNLADEIIIIDSYSSDNTVNIARKFTNKIYFNKFNDDFSEQKNYALNKAKERWILSVDADEIISPVLKKAIPKLIKKDIYDGFLIPRRQYINKITWLKHGLFYPDYQLRLFKKKGTKFVNKVHEYPKLNSKNIKKIKYYLIHNSSHTKYNKFSSIFRLEKYTEINAKELANGKHKTIIILLKGFILFLTYFFNSFLRGKGYKDGWNGFRAAIIFALFPFIASIKATRIRLINNFKQ